MQKFGEKLRMLRTQHGLSLKELSYKLCLKAHSYISELESGKKKPTTEFVLNVARLFDVSTDQLLKDEMDLE
jgi:transcriptional regulator with XRE-family HTH domain